MTNNDSFVTSFASKNDNLLPGTESSGNVEPAPFNIQVIYSYSFYHDCST